MIRIRNLEERDLAGLSEFILEIYKEHPDAMWFERAPTSADLSALFAEKLQGMGNGRVVDVIAIYTSANNTEYIAGEVEIAKLSDTMGYVGILVKKEHRNRGLGSLLLERAYGQAAQLGIRELRAEVSKEQRRGTPPIREAGIRASRD